jgi:hypothetical protein
LCPRNKFKEIFFQSYIPYINIENEVSLFWKKHKTKIKQWYLNIKRNNDLIISASPEFLLLPICTEWSVKLIATKIDIYT